VSEARPQRAALRGIADEFMVYEFRKLRNPDIGLVGWVERSERERNPYYLPLHNLVDRPCLTERLDVPDQDGGIHQRDQVRARAACESDRLRRTLGGGSSKHSRSWPVRA